MIKLIVGKDMGSKTTWHLLAVFKKTATLRYLEVFQNLYPIRFPVDHF